MEENRKTFYITTPIYYPSGNMTIGHTYTTVAADTMTRFRRMQGYDTYFLTGTDEHGQKIEKKAAEAGVSPIEYVDKIVAETKELWKLMDIEYDDFIRTTEERHIRIVQKIFRKFYEQGDIYKAEYEGMYCTPCESFWTPTQLAEKDGVKVCPDCGRPCQPMREESYFFRMSKYQDWLIDYIETHPDFIQPAKRANEMLTNFLRPGLQDLCVSRTSVKWGIPVDFDEKHTVYVWIDALSNYITALGYGTEHDELFRKYWPADIHLVGKEIVRFHTIYWPIMLHALGLPLPKLVDEQMDKLQFSQALAEIWKVIGECNKYIDLTQPWVLGKDPEKKDRLANVMLTLAECVRFAAVLIGPFMPSTPARIFAQLGVNDESLKSWDSLKTFGLLPAGTKVHKGDALFPRIDVNKELEALSGGKEEKKEAKAAEKQEKKDQKADKKADKKHEEPEYPAEIDVNEFFRCKIQVARVLACEKVEKSTKLLKFRLGLGKDGERTVVSGIQKWYEPETLVGTQVAVITNLKTAKLAGIESQGMILSALDDNGNLRLVSVGEGVEDGALIG